MIEAAMIDRARSVRIEDEIARRGVKLRGGVDRCGPCPVCGEGSDRFSINVKKQVWNCRICATGGDVIALVQRLDGCGFLDAIAYLAGAERTDCSIRKQFTTTPKQWENNRSGDTKPRALALWRGSADPRGTLVEQYLKSRALKLPDEAANEAIRFYPNCPFEGEHFPAMVCLVRNIVTNEPQAIHRTALNPDGTPIKRNGKTFRMALGPIAAGAIKIDDDADVTQGLCIGEGFESTLAGRQMGYAPAWALLNAGGIAKLPALPVLEGLTIFVENDDTSREAAYECGLRWREAGRDVFTLRPEIGSDLNDEVR